MKTIEERKAELEQRHKDALAQVEADEAKAKKLAEIDAKIGEHRVVRDKAEAEMRALRAERELISPKRPRTKPSTVPAEGKEV